MRQVRLGHDVQASDDVRHLTVGMAVISLIALISAALAGCVTQASGQHGNQADRPWPVRSPNDPRALTALPAGAATPTADPRQSPAASRVGNAAIASSAFQLLPASRRGYLAPGSNPSALPGDVLIADEDNHRLVLVDPFGRIRWQFPGRGDMPKGTTFGPPDDAFISADGQIIVATQEMADTVSVINIRTHRLVRTLGHNNLPGSAPNFFSHPDDAMVLPGDDLLLADIVNCRILILSPRRWHVVRQFGQTGSCVHNPPATFGSPNGAFPLPDGNYLITEIGGDWVDEMNLHGHVYWSVNPPGVVYPSDANAAGPNRYIVCDYSTPGQIVIFNRAGRALWRFRPTGRDALNHPSLAMLLPNGNVLANDDYNDRVIVIDPRTNRIVWQYGHTGVAGSAPGYIANPDGVDMAPPYSLLMALGRVMGRP